MNTKEFVEVLDKMWACDQALYWVAKQKNPYIAWRTCTKADWLVWLVKMVHNHCATYDDTATGHQYCNDMQAFYRGEHALCREKYNARMNSLIGDKANLDKIDKVFNEDMAKLVHNLFSWKVIRTYLDDYPRWRSIEDNLCGKEKD